MCANVTSFPFTEMYANIISKLPQRKAGLLVKKMCELFFDGEYKESGDVTIDALMISISPLLESYKSRSEISSKRSEAGRISAKVRNEKKQNEIKTESDSEQNSEEQKYQVSDNEIEQEENETTNTEQTSNKTATKLNKHSTNAEQTSNKSQQKLHTYTYTYTNTDNNILLSNKSVGSPQQKSAKVEQINFDDYKERYNTGTTLLPKCTAMTEKRKDKLRARVSEFRKYDTTKDPLEVFGEIVERVERSDFASGRTGGSRGWKCSFDWLIENSSNWVKVIEGNYDNSTAPNSSVGVIVDTHTKVYEQSW